MGELTAPEEWEVGGGGNEVRVRGKRMLQNKTVRFDNFRENW